MIWLFFFLLKLLMFAMFISLIAMLAITTDEDVTIVNEDGVDV